MLRRCRWKHRSKREELQAMVFVQPVAPQSCRCQCRSEPTPADGVGSATTIAGPSCTIGRLSIWKLEEDYVPVTGRHEHGAHGWESCGSSTHLWTDHRCYQKPLSHRGGAIHGLQHGQMIVARRSSRHGLRGVRVGEASNPGPQLARQRSPVRGALKSHSSCQQGL